MPSWIPETGSRHRVGRRSAVPEGGARAYCIVCMNDGRTDTERKALELLLVAIREALGGPYHNDRDRLGPPLGTG